MARDVLRPAGEVARSEVIARTITHIRDVLAALAEMEGRVQRLRTVKERLERPHRPGTQR